MADETETTTPAPEAPAVPPRDYTHAQAAFRAAHEHAADIGIRAASGGPMFATNVSNPDVWELQSSSLHDFWFAVAEAARA
jgi:hypothetical protein